MKHGYLPFSKVVRTVLDSLTSGFDTNGFWQSKIYCLVELFIFRSDFYWEGGGNLPQNNYKPSQDLWEATL